MTRPPLNCVRVHGIAARCARRFGVRAFDVDDVAVEVANDWMLAGSPPDYKIVAAVGRIIRERGLVMTKRRKGQLEHRDEAFWHAQVAPGPSVTEDEIDRAIDMLQPTEQTTVKATRIDNQTHREHAEDIGLTRTGASKRIERGYSRMREMFGIRRRRQ